MTEISVIIPSRNEKYLGQTINDLIAKAAGSIEIIVVLDGYWPNPIIKDDKVIYIHRGLARGMRNAINSAVAISKGKYILKCDAHCMFDEGYDVKLISDCKDNWVCVPRRYALDPEKWALVDNPKYPIDYMYLTHDLHGEVWSEKNKDPKLKEKPIDDLMSSQGSCWLMKRTYFDELELEDEENYGSFWNEMQEVGLKAWLSGGRLVVNKKTWYAHWHKSEGRGYSLGGGEQEKAGAYVQRWLGNSAWHKQTLPLTWLIEKFWPVPGWPEDKNKWTV